MTQPSISVTFVSILKNPPVQIIGQNAVIKAALLSKRYSQVRVGQKVAIQQVMDVDRAQILEILATVLSDPSVTVSTRCAS